MEAGSLVRGLTVPSIEKPLAAQHSVDGGRTDRHAIRIDHHEGESPVAFQRVLRSEPDDLFLLPRLDPVIARDLSVVLVGASVPFSPGVKLPGLQLEPSEDSADGKLCLLGQTGDEVDNLVTRVRGNPLAAQGSPSSFFSWTYSAEISAITRSFFESLASRVFTISSRTLIRFWRAASWDDVWKIQAAID